MTDSELIAAVNEVFQESFEIPPEKLKPEAQIFVDLGLDSLDVVDLVAAIQKRFNVQVRDDERVRSIRTLQDLYNYLILIRTEQNKVLYEDPEWVAYLTDRIPVKRPGQPHDLDGAVVFLASEESRYVTGQTLLIDGGISTGATRATVARKDQV